jgi:type III secretory pathway component EscV
VALLAALSIPGVAVAQTTTTNSGSATTSTDSNATTQSSDSGAAAGAGSTTTTGAGTTTTTDNGSTTNATSASVDATTSASASADTANGSTSTSIQTDLNVNVTTQQTTEIKQVIVQQNVAPVQVNFDISLGVAVPKTVKLVALPARVVEIVPQFKGYLFFLLPDGRIVIVAPDSLKIVAILAV